MASFKQELIKNTKQEIKVLNKEITQQKRNLRTISVFDHISFEELEQLRTIAGTQRWRVSNAIKCREGEFEHYLKDISPDRLGRNIITLMAGILSAIPTSAGFQLFLKAADTGIAAPEYALPLLLTAPVVLALDVAWWLDIPAYTIYGTIQGFDKLRLAKRSHKEDKLDTAYQIRRGNPSITEFCQNEIAKLDIQKSKKLSRLKALKSHHATTQKEETKQA